MPGVSVRFGYILPKVGDQVFEYLYFGFVDARAEVFGFAYADQRLLCTVFAMLES